MASTSPEPPRGGRLDDDHPDWPRRALRGWGRTVPTGADVVSAHSGEDLPAAVAIAGPRGVIGRGLGRSYGDAAQNAGGTVVDATGLAEFTLDPATGLVTASAGASIDALLRGLVPRGHFVPVTPGTRFVTVGGAIAADIHGKNHHKVGSFCDHVRAVELVLADGTRTTVGPEADPELFWATAGGMGLTGLIERATFACPRIPSSRLLVDTDRAPDLDEAMRLLAEADRHDYSVAWIDLIATGRAMGRSVITAGRFAEPDDLPASLRTAPLSYGAPFLAELPALFPPGLLNRLSIRAFNELWYRKAPRHRVGEVQDIATFFHPLDLVGGWNNLYGPRGFLQWQCVLPDAETERLRRIVERLSGAGCTSFLAVLKRFGPANAGHLSFPSAGWTLTLDIPVGDPDLAALLDELDGSVAEGGGRVYFAKDSRLRPDLVATMYPRLDEWRTVRDRVDPRGRFQSDLSRRLGLTGHEPG